MKRLFYLIVAVLVFAACNNSNQVEINGTIENGEGKELKFSELLVNGNQDIKSVQLGKDGKFKFKANTAIPRFYNLNISNNNFLTLLIEPGETVTVHAKASSLNNAIISGSDGTKLVQKLNLDLSKTKTKLLSLIHDAENLEKDKDYDKHIESINTKYAAIVDQQRDSSIAMIVGNLNSLACIVALYQKYDDNNYVLYKNRDLQYIKIVSESLGKIYPESKHVKALMADYGNLMNRYNQLKTNVQISNLVASKKVLSYPEIYLPNQSGDSISLNKLNSKYILVNFWASWSEESLQLNIKLKDVYKQYHSKGFEIYQVSLDTKEENWTRAIQFDQLPWINVIDLDGRMSYFAKIYNVNTLPTSFLINPDGEIISTNPSIDQLKSTFEYALK